MTITGLYLNYATEVKEKMRELRPAISVEIIEGDINLFKLGFVDDIPCELEINITEEEIEKILDELYDMEVSEYNCSGSKVDSSEMRKLRKIYARYEIIQILFLSI